MTNRPRRTSAVPARHRRHLGRAAPGRRARAFLRWRRMLRSRRRRRVARATLTDCDDPRRNSTSRPVVRRTPSCVADGRRNVGSDHLALRRRSRLRRRLRPSPTIAASPTTYGVAGDASNDASSDASLHPASVPSAPAAIARNRQPAAPSHERRRRRRRRRPAAPTGRRRSCARISRRSRAAIARPRRRTSRAAARARRS